MFSSLFNILTEYRIDIFWKRKVALVLHKNTVSMYRKYVQLNSYYIIQHQDAAFLPWQPRWSCRWPPAPWGRDPAPPWPYAGPATCTSLPDHCWQKLLLLYINIMLVSLVATLVFPFLKQSFERSHPEAILLLESSLFSSFPLVTPPYAWS